MLTSYELILGHHVQEVGRGLGFETQVQHSFVQWGTTKEKLYLMLDLVRVNLSSY